MPLNASPRSFFPGPVYLGLMLFFSMPSYARSQPDHPDVSRIAGTCELCHGDHGRGYGDMPSISGMPEQTFIRKLMDFRSNRMPSTVMNRIASSYSENDLAQLASYFAKR